MPSSFLSPAIFISSFVGWSLSKCNHDDVMHCISEKARTGSVLADVIYFLKLDEILFMPAVEVFILHRVECIHIKSGPCICEARGRVYIVLKESNRANCSPAFWDV